MLWRRYQDKIGGTQTHKNRFLKRYKNCCASFLESIIDEWAAIYNFEQSYMDFYAAKLYAMAWQFLIRSTKLQRTMETMPDTKPRFSRYAFSDAWDELNRNR